MTRPCSPYPFPFLAPPTVDAAALFSVTVRAVCEHAGAPSGLLSARPHSHALHQSTTRRHRRHPRHPRRGASSTPAEGSGGAAETRRRGGGGTSPAPARLSGASPLPPSPPVWRSSGSGSGALTGNASSPGDGGWADGGVEGGAEGKAMGPGSVHPFVQGLLDAWLQRLPAAAPPPSRAAGARPTPPRARPPHFAGPGAADVTPLRGQWPGGGIRRSHSARAVVSGDGNAPTPSPPASPSRWARSPGVGLWVGSRPGSPSSQVRGGFD
jgi:hypothetical protein